MVTKAMNLSLSRAKYAARSHQHERPEYANCSKFGPNELSGRLEENSTIPSLYKQLLDITAPVSFFGAAMERRIYFVADKACTI